jgi:ubiquitin thioesterase protein OTUB1
VAFCYFETLMRIGEKQKFIVEKARLDSMQSLLRDIGFQQHLYEDFVTDTLTILDEVEVATDNGAALLAAFNDFPRSQSIITYLKVG